MAAQSQPDYNDIQTKMYEFAFTGYRYHYLRNIDSVLNMDAP